MGTTGEGTARRAIQQYATRRDAGRRTTAVHDEAGCGAADDGWLGTRRSDSYNARSAAGQTTAGQRANGGRNAAQLTPGLRRMQHPTKDVAQLWRGWRRIDAARARLGRSWRSGAALARQADTRHISGAARAGEAMLQFIYRNGA